MIFMYCKNCGKEVSDDAKYCPSCGTPLNVETNSNDLNPSKLWALLGFFIPLAGLILYLIWEKEKPNTARLCGKGALISVIVGAITSVVAVVLLVILAIIGSYGPYIVPMCYIGMLGLI